MSTILPQIVWARPLAGFALILALLAGFFEASAAEPNTRAPHIIFFLADDLGPGDLGCYGGTLAPTPNIDRLAKEGVRFTQYYSAAPICSPSRAGLITGQLPARWRITSFLQTKEGNQKCEQADFLDAAAPSLPQMLKAAGYATAHFGKWHLGGGRDVTEAPKFAAYGYDENAGTWESPEPHPDITATNAIWSPKDKVKRWERTGFFVDKTLDFLARHKGQPCFVNVWLDDSHTPWVPAADAPKGTTPANLRGVLTEMDRQVGRLLAGLKAQGLEQDTLVIFASDNGPMPSFESKRTVGLRGSKLSLYEGGLRLPFIARWPGRIPAARVNNETVLSALDMLPTLAAIGKAPPPKDVAFDGENLTAALLEEKAIARTKPLLWEYGRNETSFKYPPKPHDRSPQLAVREGQWKLLANRDGKGAQLYDVVADPNETKDVAGDHAEVVARLSKLAETFKQLP